MKGKLERIRPKGRQDLPGREGVRLKVFATESSRTGGWERLKAGSGELIMHGKEVFVLIPTVMGVKSNSRTYTRIRFTVCKDSAGCGFLIRIENWGECGDPLASLQGAGTRVKS